MASPCRTRTYLLHGVQVSVTLLFVFFLTVLLLPTKSGSTERDIEEENKKVIGSKPPSCVNKCLKCRPCLATLVTPDHHQRKKNSDNKKGLFKVWSRGEDDDPYYLLSWKCTCKDKLFQP
ncbi:hypothetical protein QN277_024314 [Acacia crassicarpa]|uniref:Epidermal patterning factor-like protein n=1 Tax=Acacia crassicarpa TaxID=499986 RepID=A0AAE1K9C5_9FABA|nr:hypothetical protein QN277_024314 [Acacia crassicarpa]